MFGSLFLFLSLCSQVVIVKIVEHTHTYRTRVMVGNYNLDCPCLLEAQKITLGYVGTTDNNINTLRYERKFRIIITTATATPLGPPSREHIYLHFVVRVFTIQWTVGKREVAGGSRTPENRYNVIKPFGRLDGREEERKRYKALIPRTLT